MIVIGCFSTEGSFLGGGSLWPQWSNVHFLLSAPWLITSDVLCILCLCLHCYVFVFVYLIKCAVPTVLTIIDHQVVGDGGCNPSNGHPRPIWTRAPASQCPDHLWTTVIPLSGMIFLWPLLQLKSRTLRYWRFYLRCFFGKWPLCLLCLWQYLFGSEQRKMRNDLNYTIW